jgi:hypothetical protein
MTRLHWLGLAALMLACTACAGQPPDGAHAPHAAADARPPVLYDNLGSYSYRITTAAPGTQRWFDQGLRLVYAFNHHEAQRAFREAARLDPRCAMCFWGIAITEGSNYNAPTDAEREAIATRPTRTPHAITLSSTSAMNPSKLDLSIQRTITTRSFSGSIQMTLLPAPRAA